MSEPSLKSSPETGTQDSQAYALAKQFLLGLQGVNEKGEERGVTEEILSKYCIPPETARPDSLPGIYKQLLQAAEDRQILVNVIGDIARLGPVLCEFDPKAVLRKYGGDWKRVLDDISRVPELSGKVRRTRRGLWPLFCKTILAGASFLTQFESPAKFYEWVDFFDHDDRARAALPMLLSREVTGLGFALSCMFLMNLGYIKFAKPDVHLRTIFKALGLSRTDDDYDVFKAAVRVAKNAGVTPVSVDHLFWLIGSGDFYLDGIKTGRNRDRFTAWARSRLRACDQADDTTTSS